MATPRGRLHESVIRYVEDELAASRLATGSRLPGERALAEQLGVGRTSVREGIRVLEAMGVIRTSVGSGPDSGALVVADTSAGITAALRLHLASQTLPVSDIVETRVLLETWSVRQAAGHTDGELWGTADQLLDAMDAPQLTPVEFLALDTDFHVTLARASGNDVVAAIMTSLRESIEEYVVAAVQDLTDWPRMQRRLRREHRNIASAARDGDGDRAARLAAAHIAGFYAATRPTASAERE
jgi:GntR family transcriptional repressor for pyruvate dehydrogenase complex